MSARKRAAGPAAADDAAAPAVAARGAPEDTSGGRRASEHNETGRSNIMPLIFWVLEQSVWTLLAVPTAIATAVTLAACVTPPPIAPQSHHIVPHAGRVASGPRLCPPSLPRGSPCPCCSLYCPCCGSLLDRT